MALQTEYHKLEKLAKGNADAAKARCEKLEQLLDKQEAKMNEVSGVFCVCMSTVCSGPAHGHVWGLSVPALAWL